MSLHTPKRDKSGRFTLIKSKSRAKQTKSKPKLTQVFTPVPKDAQFAKAKRYIDSRLQEHNDYVIECLEIFLADLEGAFHRATLEWDED